MRIAMVAACPFPWPRGTPIRIHRMAEALGRRGHDVHVVTYHIGSAVTTQHMTVHRIAGPSRYTRTASGPTITKLAILDPLLVRALRQLLQSRAFDVIHAHHYEGLLTALVARSQRRPPVVFDSHTLLEAELPSYGWRLTATLSRCIGRFLDRELPRLADRVIAVSDEIRSRLETAGRMRPETVSVISNGVEVEHFRAPAGDPSQEHVLLFAGNLASYQGIEVLLHAFAAVRKANARARLRILTGDSFKAFAPLCSRLSIEPFVDVMDANYDSLPQHLSRATVLANPRLNCSGIPQKLLNYMASGTPIVSFAGSAKLVTHEHSGIVVADGDTDAFAAAVLRLMGDARLRRELGTRALEIVARDYSWDQVAARVEAVYAQVAVR